MKKTLLIVALLGLLVGIYAFHTSSVNSYLLTPNGVDYIRLGRDFVENPPQGALYDNVKIDSDEYNTYYVFYRQGMEIGSAIADKTRKIHSIRVYDCPVHLDNGIRIGSSIREAWAKEGVGVNVLYYLDEPEASPSITLTYKGIDILLSVEDLSSSGKKKIENYAYQLQPADFNPKGTVRGFLVPAQ